MTYPSLRHVADVVLEQRPELSVTRATLGRAVYCAWQRMPRTWAVLAALHVACVSAALGEAALPRRRWVAKSISGERSLPSSPTHDWN